MLFGGVINNGNKAPAIKGTLATNPQKRDSITDPGKFSHLLCDEISNYIYYNYTMKI